MIEISYSNAYASATLEIILHRASDIIETYEIELTLERTQRICTQGADALIDAHLEEVHIGFFYVHAAVEAQACQQPFKKIRVVAKTFQTSYTFETCKSQG